MERRSALSHELRPITARRAWPRWVIVLLALLVVIELLKTILTCGMGQPVPGYDALEYWRLGEQLAAGDWWLRRAPVAHRTPGYPALLAVAQAWCDSSALLAVVVAQHLCVMATSILTAGLAWRITRSPTATLTAYAVSALSIARPWYANVLLTETVFALLLVVHLHALLSALRGLSLSTAVAAGVSFGACLLVRPVVQGLWLPEAVVLLTYGRFADVHVERRRGVALVAVVLGTAVLVIVPWLVRNSVVFGQPFLTRFLGRELWISTFADGAGAGLPLPTGPDSERLRQLVRQAEQPVDLRGNWQVSNALTDAGLSDVEADALMRRVALAAIRKQPRVFVRSVARRGGNFWRVVEGTFGSYGDVDPEAAEKFGQRVWWSDTLRAVYRPVIEHAPVHWLWFNTLAALLTWGGVIGLCWSRPTRAVGLLLGLMLLYFNATTALLEIPTYRYRLVIEPLMIVALTAGLRQVWSSFSRSKQAPGLNAVQTR